MPPLETTDEFEKRGDCCAGASPELMKTLVASIAEAMVVADATSNLVLHNPASLALHGYNSQEEALGAMADVASVWQLFDLAGNPLSPELWPMARALSGERFSHYEVRVRRTDTGKEFTGSYSGTPIFNESGALRCALITIHDVTQQKEAEALLQQRGKNTRLQLAELDSIYRTAPVGLCVLDTDLRYVRINEQLAQINGLPAAEHIGRTVREIVPHLAEAAEPLFRQVLETREALRNVEVTGYTAAQPGVRRSWLEHFYPIFNENGQVVGLNITVEEITGRKRNEALLEQQKRSLEAELEAHRQTELALRESEARFRTLLMEVPIGICICDDQRRILHLNHAFTHLTGYSPEDIPTIDCWMRLACRGRVEDLSGTIGSLVHHDEPFDGEQELWTAWDELRTFRVNSVALKHFNEGGRMRLSTFVDITDRLQMEQALLAGETELRELNRSLEKRVEKRTRALARTGQALLEARDRFFTLFHASPVPTQLTALDDHTILDANAAFANFLNLANEQIVGQKADELARLMNARETQRERMRTLLEQEGRAANLEMQLTNGAGQERVMLVSVELAALDGRPVAITTLIDVTERVEAERQVSRLATALFRAEEQERARIAQLLHDDVQQMIMALQMQGQIGLMGDGDKMKEALEYVVNYSAETIEKLRSLSMELSSLALQGSRLPEGLAWICTFMEERYNLEVHLEAAEEADVPDPDVRALLLRLVRELLFNVVKHAGTGRAQIRARLEAGTVIIQVIDKGQGFDPVTLNQGLTGTGFGLVSMGDRLRLFGGHIEVESIPGDGTCVTLHIPQQIPGS